MSFGMWLSGRHRHGITVNKMSGNTRLYKVPKYVRFFFFFFKFKKVAYDFPGAACSAHCFIVLLLTVTSIQWPVLMQLLLRRLQ